MNKNGHIMDYSVRGPTTHLKRDCPGKGTGKGVEGKRKPAGKGAAGSLGQGEPEAEVAGLNICSLACSSQRQPRPRWRVGVLSPPPDSVVLERPKKIRLNV